MFLMLKLINSYDRYILFQYHLRKCVMFSLFLTCDQLTPSVKPLSYLSYLIFLSSLCCLFSVFVCVCVSAGQGFCFGVQRLLGVLGY